MSFAANYLEEVKQVVAGFDPKVIEDAVALLDKVRSRGGRLFILGVGGGAPNASRAVNDFRKIYGFECFSEIHQRISKSLPIGRIEVCYDCYDPSEFRKPNPGMLKRAAGELDVDLAAVEPKEYSLTCKGSPI